MVCFNHSTQKQKLDYLCVQSEETKEVYENQLQLWRLILWIFTKDGFFSVVFDKYCKRGELMIRSRCKDDLVRLAKKLHGYSDKSEILGIKHADYRYRMRITKNNWADYLTNCALDIDYANVKDNIVPAGDDLRQDAYYQVWTALYRWQSMIKSINFKE